MVRRRPQCAWIRPLAPWKTWRNRAAVALALGIIAFAGDEGRTASGCARCGEALMAPPMAFNPMVPAFAPQRVEPARREERRPEQRMAGGGGYTVCVRTCDGSFFPVTYFGAATRADGLENVCRALCPNAEVALYSFPLGGTIDQAVSSTGKSYDNLPNAHKFEQVYDPSCTCRAPGQSWAQALARAEAKYGGHTHDIFVTAAVSARMSLPAPAPRAKPVAPTPDLDVNGVDKELRAEAAAMSRAGSGIGGDDGQRARRYSLKAGRRVEEAGPDGSTRRVRILP